MTIRRLFLLCVPFLACLTVIAQAVAEPSNNPKHQDRQLEDGADVLRLIRKLDQLFAIRSTGSSMPYSFFSLLAGNALRVAYPLTRHRQTRYALKWFDQLADRYQAVINGSQIAYEKKEGDLYLEYGFPVKEFDSLQGLLEELDKLSTKNIKELLKSKDDLAVAYALRQLKAYMDTKKNAEEGFYKESTDFKVDTNKRTGSSGTSRRLRIEAVEHLLERLNRILGGRQFYATAYKQSETYTEFLEMVRGLRLVVLNSTFQPFSTIQRINELLDSLLSFINEGEMIRVDKKKGLFRFSYNMADLSLVYERLRQVQQAIPNSCKLFLDYDICHQAKLSIQSYYGVLKEQMVPTTEYTVEEKVIVLTNQPLFQGIPEQELKGGSAHYKLLQELSRNLLLEASPINNYPESKVLNELRNVLFAVGPLLQNYGCSKNYNKPLKNFLEQARRFSLYAGFEHIATTERIHERRIIFPGHYLVDLFNTIPSLAQGVKNCGFLTDHAKALDFYLSNFWQHITFFSELLKQLQLEHEYFHERLPMDGDQLNLLQFKDFLVNQRPVKLNRPVTADQLNSLAKTKVGDYFKLLPDSLSPKSISPIIEQTQPLMTFSQIGKLVVPTITKPSVNLQNVDFKDLKSPSKVLLDIKPSLQGEQGPSDIEPIKEKDKVISQELKQVKHQQEKAIDDVSLNIVSPDLQKIEEVNQEKQKPLITDVLESWKKDKEGNKPIVSKIIQDIQEKPEELVLSQSRMNLQNELDSFISQDKLLQEDEQDLIDDEEFDKSISTIPFTKVMEPFSALNLKTQKSLPIGKRIDKTFKEVQTQSLDEILDKKVPQQQLLLNPAFNKDLQSEPQPIVLELPSQLTESILLDETGNAQVQQERAKVVKRKRVYVLIERMNCEECVNDSYLQRLIGVKRQGQDQKVF